MTYPNAVFSVFAFTGFLMCSIPFPWHLEGKYHIFLNFWILDLQLNSAWNTGTCLYMAWAGVACLMQFINSVVWNGNAINWAPVWCDICTFLLLSIFFLSLIPFSATRIWIGASFGIPAASLCINRRLYQIASVKSVTITRAEKRRAVIIDLAIGVGLSVLGMVLRMSFFPLPLSFCL